MNSGIFRTGMLLKRFHHNNLILVGDVGLQGNPVVGEGIRFVMDAARMASEAVAEAVEKGDIGLLHRYSDAWVRKYRSQYKAGYILQRLLLFLTRYEKLCDKAVRRGQRS